MVLIRSALFAFCGGFALADLYSNAVRASSMVNAQAAAAASSDGKSSSRWWSRSKSSPPVDTTNWVSRFEEGTLRADMDQWIDENQVVALFALLVLLWGGGVLAMAGAGTCVVFDGDVGAERYNDLRDEFVEWWDGNRKS